MMKRYIMTSNKSFYIYRTILIVLCMIAMAACGGGTPKNTNNNVQQNTIHTTAGLPLTPLVCPSDQAVVVQVLLLAVLEQNWPTRVALLSSMELPSILLRLVAHRPGANQTLLAISTIFCIWRLKQDRT